MAFNIEIISPDKLIFNEEVDMVIIPALEGDIGILEKHMPLVTSLRLGLVYIYKNQKLLKKFLINGGIIEVFDNKCTLLSEDISDVDVKLEKQENDELHSQKLKVISNQYYN